MVAQADVTHVERGSVSNITGTGTVRSGPGTTVANSWFDVDARLHPLSLVTVGRLFPAAGLRGSATGPLRLTGTTRNLAVHTDLGFPDGGSASIDGRLDLASFQKGYDLSLETVLFNANSIFAKAPRTSLTATASAVGRGTNPATMNARLIADVKASTYDTLAIDSAKIRVVAANGIARVDTLAFGVPQGLPTPPERSGLRRDKSGDLRYHVSSRLAPEAGDASPAAAG